MTPLIYPSPNHDSRNGQAIDMVVLHYTHVLTAQEALDILTSPQRRVSAHYLITKEGQLYQLVAESQRAWHAGVSYWKGHTNINCRSIGIELDNPGHPPDGQPMPEAFAQPLMETLEHLLEHLVDRYGIPPEHIVGHMDVAPLRKNDPGELFDWGRLQRRGWGLNPQLPQETLELQHYLRQLGYDCPLTGLMDPVTERLLAVARHHSVP